VNIWATLCAPCKEEMPALDRLEAKLGGETFAVLPICVDRGGLQKPRSFLEEIDADNLPLLLDETARLNFKFEVMGLPATLIIDEQGREIARMIGPAEWDSPEAIARLRQFMAAEG
jgi:thiol-disulfide isomerase/thioredoxin